MYAMTRSKILIISVAAVFAPNCWAAKAINGIETNYAIYDATGVNFSPGFRNTWYIPPQHLRTTVGLYQLNPTQVGTQLTAMRNSGMTDIAIPIWMSDFHGQDPDGLVDWVYGEFIDYSQAGLRLQQRTNLSNLVTAIKNKGFKRILIRFGPTLNWPIPNTWDENEYQHYWNLVVSTKNLIDGLVAGSQTKVFYDLAFEYGGYDDGGIRPQFIKRLWGDFAGVLRYIADCGFFARMGTGPLRTARTMVRPSLDSSTRDVFLRCLSGCGRQHADRPSADLDRDGESEWISHFDIGNVGKRLRYGSRNQQFHQWRVGDLQHEHRWVISVDARQNAGAQQPG